MPADTPQHAAQAHADSIARFLAAARTVSDAAWERPISDGHWSPAQVAEHVRMAYALVQNQLSGGSGMRIRTSWLVRLMLRWRSLPRILASGRLPDGVRAPRELRPGDGPYPREQVLQALQVAAGNVQEILVRHWDDRNCRVTHFILGDLDPPTAMQFATVHTNHHARQLEDALGRPAGRNG